MSQAILSRIAFPAFRPVCQVTKCTPQGTFCRHVLAFPGDPFLSSAGTRVLLCGWLATPCPWGADLRLKPHPGGPASHLPALRPCLQLPMLCLAVPPWCMGLPTASLLLSISGNRRHIFQDQHKACMLCEVDLELG